jgi:predicted nucleic acid-binding Zn ribbon protein
MTKKSFTHCPVCSKQIVQEAGRGRAVKYCSEQCRNQAEKERSKGKVYGKCVVDGCACDATRLNKYCEKHYMRIRRNGNTEKIQPKQLTEHSHGYVIEHCPGHPLSIKNRVYQHRRVYHDVHGEGPFICHWCQIQVGWLTMHIDHVDANRKNNSISNLVASCPKCNQARGKEKLRETLKQKHGVTFNGKTMALSAWAKHIGVSNSTLAERLKKGMTLGQALTIPKANTGPKPGKTSAREAKARASGGALQD